MTSDDVLECLGLYCPMPIVKTAQRIQELEPGQVLEIVSDDRGIKSDMPAWCSKTGNEFLGIEERDGEFHVFVRRH
ncbi:MAG: sulfurtransferase TusA family protein [Candidatus Geothermincolia bacterium]